MFPELFLKSVHALEEEHSTHRQASRSRSTGSSPRSAPGSTWRTRTLSAPRRYDAMEMRTSRSQTRTSSGRPQARARSKCRRLRTRRLLVRRESALPNSATGVNALLGWNNGGLNFICEWLRPSAPLLRPNQRRSSHLGRAERVVTGELELRLEHSSLERRLRRSRDQAGPGEEVRLGNRAWWMVDELARTSKTGRNAPAVNMLSSFSEAVSCLYCG